MNSKNLLDNEKVYILDKLSDKDLKFGQKLFLVIENLEKLSTSKNILNFNYKTLLNMNYNFPKSLQITALKTEKLLDSKTTFPVFYAKIIYLICRFYILNKIKKNDSNTNCFGPHLS